MPDQPTPAFTVPAGKSGFYTLTNTRLQIGEDQVGETELRVFARHAGLPEGRQPEAAVMTRLGAGEAFDFDTFLGYLAAGDTVHVAVAPSEGEASAKTQVDYQVERAPEIVVSAFPEDAGNPVALDAPGAWAIMADVPAGDVQARLLGWGVAINPAQKASDLTGSVARLHLGNAGRELIAAFRVPQSGYYALHNAQAVIPAGDEAQARIYVGRDASARSTVPLVPGKAASLDTELGYIEKGEVVHVAFESAKPTTVEFSATVVEWAPRRAPLRVRRGTDGLFDVFEPAAPRKAIDIPADRWITVPAREEDATEAIRKAIAEAVALRQGESYVGVRLESGKRYVLASNQAKGGPIFEIKNIQRFVFDGNGATLWVNSPVGQRERLNLFTTSASREVVLADFAVDTVSNGFSVGEVLDVSPMEKGNQTVTFRVLPDQPDPISDIRRDGQASGYGYDAQIPGRSTVGGWSHYPGADVKPQLKATEQPGIFKHTVTRTNQAISVGSKWLIKNKGSCIQFLTTGGGSENITLSGVIDRGGSGGYLLFWQTSGINILDCIFEPQGTDWIGSTSDGVHGRGREGVWIENTLIRGVCEDVMNTYGVSMVVVPDEQPEDNVMTFGLFDGGRRDKDGFFVLGKVSDDMAQVGDELTFFNPSDGRVLGYAKVRESAAGRCVLSNSISGVTTWDKTKGKAAVTMVYNNRLAARFFMRDSRIMDSLRFGVFIKARGGAIFNTHFEGLASHAVFAANEPEWPEGPPPTHLWLQGNTFYQNDYGYCGLNRAFLTADPAQVSIYTRRLRGRDVPPGFAAHLTRGQYPNAHMKIVGNTFADWRGTGVSIRNARNVQITDNLFLPPIDDSAMRATLAKDPAMSANGAGRYAGIFMDSIIGGRIANNRFIDLPAGDQAISKDQDVRSVLEMNNAVAASGSAEPSVELSFGEWFGSSSVEPGKVGAVQDRVELHGATHRVGRLGAGLAFSGSDDYAVLRASEDLLGRPVQQMTLALWACPEDGGKSEQVLYSHGDSTRGVVIAIAKGRFVAGLWQSGKGSWLDLGPAVVGLWQHVALVYDGQAGSLRGFVDGLELSSAAGMPKQLDAIPSDAVFGRSLEGMRLDAERVISGTAPYRGLLDEFRLFHSAQVDLGILAMRRPATAR